jgi:uncharacterized protein
LILAALLVAAVASPAAAANPSFPCSGALTVSERAICSDDDLAALDRKVATAYRNKSDGLPIESANALEVVVQGLVVTQKAWIAHRNSCGADRSCIRNAYVIRLRALTAGDNAKDVPCRDTVGSKQAAAYVKECIAVATETHPPCNADNFCELIVSHNIYRCAGLGDQGPKSCATYRSK